MLNPAKEARKLITKFGIEKPYVDVKDIAIKLGAQVILQQDSDDDLSGMIFVSPKGVVIGVNSLHPETRQRFTIAHEIGHMIMHMHILQGDVHIDKKFGIQLNRDKRSSLGSDFLEIQANKFAAELLMPSTMIKKEIKNTYIDIEKDDEQVKALAEKYKVSQQAMSIRLFENFSSDWNLFEEE